MKRLAPFLLALLAAGTSCAAAGATLNMNEGLWETTISADGREQSANTRCYTRADIAEMERRLRGQSTRADSVCRYADFTQSGNSVNYTMTCRLGETEQRSSVSASYHGDSSIGTIRSAGVIITAAGRRIGSCTESSFAQ